MLEMNYVAQHRALLTPSQSLPWKLCFQHLPKDMKIKLSHPACCYFSPSCFIFIFKKGIWALFPSLQSFGTSPWAQTFSSLLHPLVSRRERSSPLPHSQGWLRGQQSCHKMENLGKKLALTHP